MDCQRCAHAITSISKNQHYRTQFGKCKNNIKATWKLIGTLVKRKSKGLMLPTRLIRNNKIYTSKSDIANQFNEHFVQIGQNLASTITDYNVNPIHLYT